MIIKEKCCAIIVAGGKGKRMSEHTLKQFILLENKPILAHTLDKFENNPNVNEIILVIGKEQIDFCKINIIDKYNYKKVIAVIEGGNERQDSVYNGLKRASDNTNIILIHDGVRPFIDKEHINNIIATTINKNACVLAVPCKDTIKLVNTEKTVEESLDRSRLWCMQTPQGFKYEIILEAHKNAKKLNLLGTDDSTLVEELGEKVYVVEGDYKNIKITTKEDLDYAKFLLLQNT